MKKIIHIRIDEKIDESLVKKALELNTTKTEIVVDGINYELGRGRTTRQETEILVRNQQLFNELFKLLQDEESKVIAYKILEGEKTLWLQ